MTDAFNGRPGFAVVCNYDGLITEVLWDDFALGDNLVGLSHFACIFDPASVQKGLALFLHVKEQGAAFNWEINLVHHGEPRAFLFGAAALSDRIVLLASSAPIEEGRICDGLSHLVNQQINSLRVLSKRAAKTSARREVDSRLPERFNGDMFKDMLQLNNRLVNAERELARKNAELKRMAAVLSKDLYLAHRALQCLGEAVVIVGSDRRVIDVNQAYTAITGVPKHEIVGNELLLGEPHHHEPEGVDAIWKAVTRRGLWQGECASRRKSGEMFPQWLTVSTVPEESGDTSHYVVIFSDITRLKNAEERLQRLAFYDSLTDLPNRVLFKDRLERAIVRARRDGASLALLFIDLDDFKIVNDSLGHDAGDRVLGEAARRIASCVRETDSVSRLGGDEFTVIIEGCPTDADALRVSEKIIRAFDAPFHIGGHDARLGTSIGISRFPLDGDDPDTLIKNADAAMYAAKSAGRNTSRFFAKSLGERISQQLQVKTQIALGLQRGEFQLHLQPEVDLNSGRVLTLEALIRWQHPERGEVAPDDFIPIAEESGLIVDLGEFVIREAARLARYLRAGLPDLRIAINVSRRQLAAPGLADLIGGELDRQGLPGSALIVEVTESMVMCNMEHALQVLDELRIRGVSAAIDDFGTGHSSLTFLHRLPVEFLKIDKSFIADADVSHASETIVRAIIAMARNLGLKTIAEGIERRSQRDLLAQLGCDIGQGYWYTRPQPYAPLLEWLGSRNQ